MRTGPGAERDARSSHSLAHPIALPERLVDGYPAPMPKGEAGPAFRGREQEFARLQVALADRAARPCCLIGGEAGIGKTRLITEVARWAASEGATVVIGGCLELGADVLPFAPFVEALDRLDVWCWRGERIRTEARR